MSSRLLHRLSLQSNFNKPAWASDVWVRFYYIHTCLHAFDVSFLQDQRPHGEQVWQQQSFRIYLSLLYLC